MESSSDLRRTHAELGLHHSTNAKLDYKYRESSIMSYFYTNVHAREHSWALGISCVMPEQPQLFLARADQQSPKRFLTKAHGCQEPFPVQFAYWQVPSSGEQEVCVRTHITEPVELIDRDLSQAWYITDKSSHSSTSTKKNYWTQTCVYDTLKFRPYLLSKIFSFRLIVLIGELLLHLSPADFQWLSKISHNQNRATCTSSPDLAVLLTVHGSA